MAIGPMVILVFTIIAAATQSAQTISNSDINQYVTANCTSEAVVHSDHPALSVFNVEKYGAVGDGKHDSTQAFVRAWHAACRKSSAMLLVPANKIFLVNNLLFQGPCQPGFIFKVDGMIAATQNPERENNINIQLQFAKLECFTLMGRGLIDGQGEKLWADQREWVKEQRSVAAKQRVIKGRTLLQPTKPKPLPGHGPEHN